MPAINTLISVSLSNLDAVKLEKDTYARNDFTDELKRVERWGALVWR